MAAPDTRGKPLKLGHLFIPSGKFTKVLKHRFCLLTTNNELDWYKKQEVFGMHTCTHACTIKRGYVTCYGTTPTIAIALALPPTILYSTICDLAS
jgi:hypothetical protein